MPEFVGRELRAREAFYPSEVEAVEKARKAGQPPPPTPPPVEPDEKLLHWQAYRHLVDRQRDIPEARVCRTEPLPQPLPELPLFPPPIRPPLAVVDLPQPLSSLSLPGSLHIRPGAISPLSLSLLRVCPSGNPRA